MSKKLEKILLRDMRRAIYDFGMIQDGDKILVGVSGGKDSMVLAYLLSELRKAMKEKFEIKGVYIFKEFLIKCDIDFQEKKDYFDKLGVELVKIDIRLPTDSKVNDGLGQSCQWCAYARRVSMMKLCQQWGANKIAFGHHMDDIVVTSFMNMIQGRKLKIMPPVNKMSRGDVTFIRPLAYAREKNILKYANYKEIPYTPCRCPVGETGKRQQIKKVIWDNEKILDGYTENIFWALIKDFKEKYEKIGYSM